MSKTYKQRAIEAIEFLIKKYEWLLENGSTEPLNDKYDEESLVNNIKKQNKENWFLNKKMEYTPHTLCPLCKIYKKGDRYCYGCPAASKYGLSGCTRLGYMYRTETIGRLAYWKRRLSYLRKVPAKYFTPRYKRKCYV